MMIQTGGGDIDSDESIGNSSIVAQILKLIHWSPFEARKHRKGGKIALNVESDGKKGLRDTKFKQVKGTT